MSILPQLMENRGTVSSALGKALASEVLSGSRDILGEAAELLYHELKNVRAGAAKIVEQVAVSGPGLVVPLMPGLPPALDLSELQSRWMVIHTLGLCAALDPRTAAEALPKARLYMQSASGVCLWGATVKYLGHLASTPRVEARRVFPLLMQAYTTIPKLRKVILESLLQLCDQGDEPMRRELALLADSHLEDDKPSVPRAARKLGRAIPSLSES